MVGRCWVVIRVWLVTGPIWAGQQKSKSLGQLCFAFGSATIYKSGRHERIFICEKSFDQGGGAGHPAVP